MIFIIIALIAVGIFEIWVYRQTKREEDFYVIAFSFFGAAFLALILSAGGWS